MQTEKEEKSEKTVHKGFYVEKKSSDFFDILFNSLGLAINSYHAREGEEHEDKGRDDAFKTLHDAKEMIMRQGIHRWVGIGNA